MSFLSGLGQTLLGGAALGPLGSALGFKKGFGGALGNQQQDVTTTSAPWGPQQQYLTDIFGRAQGLANQSPNSLVPNYSPMTMQGISALGNGAGMGNAVNFTNATLNGDYLNSNPYLDQTYQRGANQIKANMSSMFGGAGRFGSGAMANATANGLENLSNDIYGGNYQAERGRQIQAAGMAPNILMAPAMAQLQGGQMLDQQNQQRAMAPWQQLGLYQGSVTGNYGGTQTQPYFQNKGAGLLGGALTGGMLGSKFGPWGAGIGALAGGVLGMQ